MINQLFFICQLCLADGTDDLEADGAGLELGPFGFLVPLRVTPLRVDLLLPARHPSNAARAATTGGLLSPAIESGSAPRAAPCSSRESGFFFFAYVAVPFLPPGSDVTPSSAPGLRSVARPPRGWASRRPEAQERWARLFRHAPGAKSSTCSAIPKKNSRCSAASRQAGSPTQHRTRCSAASRQARSP